MGSVAGMEARIQSGVSLIGVKAKLGLGLGLGLVLGVSLIGVKAKCACKVHAPD